MSSATDGERKSQIARRASWLVRSASSTIRCNVSAGVTCGSIARSWSAIPVTLEQTVVDLARDARPLVEHRRKPRGERSLARPTQGARGALTIRDVHDHAHELLDFASGIQNGPADALRVPDGSIGAHDPIRDVETRALLDGAVEGLHHALAIVRVHAPLEDVAP